MRARLRSNLRLCPLLQLHPHLWLHLLQEEVAAGEKALLPRWRPRPGLPCTRQPKLQPPIPLLHQEMPVYHWKPQHRISNTIPPCDILPTSFSPLRPHQGVAESCPWGGCQDGQRYLLAASTWTAHLLPHLSPHQLHHHSLLHLLQGQLYGCAMSVWNTLAAVTRVLQTWLSK